MIFGIIYKAKNVINDKVYIGQTTKKLIERIRDHQRNINRKNYPFYNGLGKHGKENFIWSEIDRASTRDELDSKEEYWIDFYRSTEKKFGYNAKSGGRVPVFNAETRNKISKTSTGRKFSAETKKKMSDIHLGKAIRPKGFKMSESQKLSLSRANKGQGSGRKIPRDIVEKTRRKLIGIKKSPEHVNKVKAALLISENMKVQAVVNMDTGRIYDRISHAAKSYNVASANITACCRKKPKHATSAGCRWEYFPIPFESPATDHPAESPSP